MEHLARALHIERPQASDELAIAVRALLHQRVAIEKIPMELANTRGFEIADVERELRVAVEEERGRFKRRMRAALAVGLAAVGGAALVDAFLGTSRAIGAALLVVAIVMVSGMLASLLREVRGA